MLDFSEALGRMLSDDAWRKQLFSIRAVVRETQCSIVFPPDSYTRIRGLLFGRLVNRSHSLETDGEVLRLAALQSGADLVNQLAGNLLRRRLQLPSRSADFYCALGALTIDQVLRDQFIAVPTGVQEIPGLGAQDLSDLSNIIGDADYVRLADALCLEAWSDGCSVRIRHYSVYAHPKPQIRKP